VIIINREGEPFKNSSKRGEGAILPDAHRESQKGMNRD